MNNYIVVLKDYSNGRKIKKAIRATSLNNAFEKAHCFVKKRITVESVFIAGA